MFLLFFVGGAECANYKLIVMYGYNNYMWLIMQKYENYNR